MKIKVGINGFGRIGRKVARLALQDTRIEIVGIEHDGSRVAPERLAREHIDLQEGFVHRFSRFGRTACARLRARGRE